MSPGILHLNVGLQGETDLNKSSHLDECQMLWTRKQSPQLHTMQPSYMPLFHYCAIPTMVWSCVASLCWDFRVQTNLNKRPEFQTCFGVHRISSPTEQSRQIHLPFWCTEAGKKGWNILQCPNKLASAVYEFNVLISFKTAKTQKERHPSDRIKLQWKDWLVQCSHNQR